MNEIAQLFRDLLADLLRVEVLKQFVAMGIAFGAWLALKAQFGLESRW
jgi:hypothetical protein